MSTTNLALIEKTITAENQYSEWATMKGHFNFSLVGTFDALVTVQRSFDGGSTALDVARFLSETQESAFEPENNVMYRFGVKTGDFISGTISGRLSR